MREEVCPRSERIDGGYEHAGAVYQNSAPTGAGVIRRAEEAPETRSIEYALVTGITPRRGETEVIARSSGNQSRRRPAGESVGDVASLLLATFAVSLCADWVVESFYTCRFSREFERLGWKGAVREGCENRTVSRRYCLVI